MCSQSFLQGSRNKAAAISIIQESGILHQIDSLLQGIVLMCDAVMKHFTHGVVIVLLHYFREHCSTWHFAHRQVMHFGKYLVNSQDEWCCEVFIVNHILMFVP